MYRAPARWTSYLALGAILGFGFLAKEDMLPIGVLILAITFFVVEDWHPARKMAAGALAFMFLIGSLYFVPLSRQEGHFTVGESSIMSCTWTRPTRIGTCSFPAPHGVPSYTLRKRYSQILLPTASRSPWR